MIDIPQCSEVDTGGDKELEVFDFSNYPLPKKTQKVLRIFYNNVNGLEINSAIATVLNNKKEKQKNEFIRDLEYYTKLEAFIKQMNAWQVDISALAEPCIEWRDSIPRKVVQDVGKKYDKSGTWTVATSECYSGSYVKPGGALIYSATSVAGKIIERGTDPWKYGRWSYTVYAGKAGTSLMVVGGYRVGHRSNNAGASTAWYQQKVLLTKDQRDIEPEMAFVQDMEEWITEKIKENMEVIILLDANEQWEQKSNIRKMAKNLNLFNLDTDGEYNFPPTHPCIHNRSRDTTIDYFLCTQKVLKNINYATLTPYDLHTLGDHRGFLVDVDITKILTSPDIYTNSQNGRKLDTTNPQTVKKYLEHVDVGFKHQNIYRRLSKLYYQWGNRTKDKWDIMKTYEKLDSEIFHICNKAEKKCKTTFSGRYKWSPALSKAIKTLAFWKAKQKYGDKNKVLLKKLARDADIAYIDQLDENIPWNIQKSRDNLKHIQDNAVQYRRAHLEELANRYASDNNLTKANAVSELMSHESVRSLYSLLRDKLKSTKSGQLTKLWVAYDAEGNFIKDTKKKTEFTSSSDVHNMILRRNQLHLGQAKGTPFATGIWADKLKWDGTGELGRDMLSGNILNKDKFSRTVQLYFESLKKRQFSEQLHLVRPTLSMEEYKKFWHKKKESTVTSPFGLHVGHYKAALQHAEILNVHRLLLLIPFQTGIVPHRWKKTVQTLLEKDPGHPWIHRLRIIELFDSQVNAGFQIFIGRKMVWEAVKTNSLHPASYGSTPGKMAVSAVLQKVLVVDQLRVERRAGGLFDCDAKGCYDRIIPPLASIHLQALHLDQSIATLLARLMYTAKRYVKTKHGVSKKFIRTTRESPLYGIGQGNGGGPGYLASSFDCHVYSTNVSM